MSTPHFDVVIIGAGAAGLFCAGIAGQRGLRVLLIDHSSKVAEKVRISGGGRANFTNRLLDPAAPQRHFISDNPHFCRSALSRYTPPMFMDLLTRHGVPFHEKHKGQLFCDRSAQDLIDVLLAECDAGGVTRWQPCRVERITYNAEGKERYEIDSNLCPADAPQEPRRITAHNVVIATGGLSIPKIGATDFGHRIAKQFGLRLVPTRPGLVPLTFDAADWAPFADLAGLAVPATLETGVKKQRMAFDEDVLFTHRGLSGPGVLQISSYWRPELDPTIRLHLLPGMDWSAWLADVKLRSRKLLVNELATQLPTRLAEAWIATDPRLQRPVPEVPDKALAQLAANLSAWRLTPSGTEGHAKAEVTVGGVDTRDVSSQTMESKQPGLYFIGEVLDVTGWLGGYNFQWAWASGFACGVGLSA